MGGLNLLIGSVLKGYIPVTMTIPTPHEPDTSKLTQ